MIKYNYIANPNLKFLYPKISKYNELQESLNSFFVFNKDQIRQQSRETLEEIYFFVHELLATTVEKDLYDPENILLLKVTLNLLDEIKTECSRYGIKNFNSDFLTEYAFSQLTQDKTPIIEKSDINKSSYYNLTKEKIAILKKLNQAEFDKNHPALRKKLNEINAKLVQMINQIPEIQKLYKNYSACTLINDFSSLNNKEKQSLINNFIDLSKVPTNILNYDLQFLGGLNNRLWIATNKQQDKKYILLREQYPVTNTAFLSKLNHSAINQFLATKYCTVISSDIISAPYAMHVMEFANQGNLYDKRKALTQAAENDVIDSAVTDIAQVIDLCVSLINNNACHTDIKLTNFLLNDGKLMIADTKALIETSDDKSIIITKQNKSDLNTTEIYLPPEWDILQIADSKVDQLTINAEKFMSYQIGLALYEYLILPPKVHNKQDKFWSEQSLNFNLPIFNTPVGQQLKHLIERLTDKDPKSRYTFAEAKMQLNKISLQLAQHPLEKETSNVNLRYT